MYKVPFAKVKQDDSSSRASHTMKYEENSKQPNYKGSTCTALTGDTCDLYAVNDTDVMMLC